MMVKTVFIQIVVLLCVAACAWGGNSAVDVSVPEGQLLEQLRLINPTAMKRALVDLEKMFPDRYPESDHLHAQVDAIAKKLSALIETFQRDGKEQVTRQQAEVIFAFQRDLLISRNPLVDFDKLMVIRRRSLGGKTNDLGLPRNSSSNPQLFNEYKEWDNAIDNEIVTFSLKQSYEKASVLYRPKTPSFVGDIDLHWDGEKILFSQGNKDKW
jgi:hypothetical protein